MLLKALEGLAQYEYELFGIKIGVKTNLEGLEDSLSRIYSTFPSANGDLPKGRSQSLYSVFGERDIDRSREHFFIFKGPEMVYQTHEKDTILPYLEWFINNDVLGNLPIYYHLHAGVVSRNGRGFVLPGSSGSGKTTLVLGLLENGFRYLSDEFAMIDPKSLQVIPFPRNIYVYKKAVEYAPILSLARTGVEGPLDLAYQESSFSLKYDVPHERKGEACPVDYVIFPKYDSGEKPRLRSISKGTAMLKMIRASLNFFDHGGSAIEILTDVLQQSECFSLTSSNLRDTVDLLVDLSDRAH